VNNYRFIKSLNAMGENYAFARAVPTVLYPTPMPVDLDPAVADDVGEYLLWIGGAIGLSGVALGIYVAKQRTQKLAKCAKLINKYLKSEIKEVISAVANDVFGYGLGENPAGALALGLPQLLRQLQQMYTSLKTGAMGMGVLNTWIDNFTPPTDADGTPAELRQKLKDCLSSFPSLMKNAFKRYVMDRLPSLPENLLDKMEYIIDKYLTDGDLAAFGYAFVITIGSGMTVALAQQAAELLVAGFTDDYGVATTVLVGVLAAALLLLATIPIASWAASAISSLISASGLSVAARTALQNLINQLAKGLVPG
jgi:hypothetical protein